MIHNAVLTGHYVKNKNVLRDAKIQFALEDLHANKEFVFNQNNLQILKLSVVKYSKLSKKIIAVCIDM
jgi:hypothetical protein